MSCLIAKDSSSKQSELEFKKSIFFTRQNTLSCLFERALGFGFFVIALLLRSLHKLTIYTRLWLSLPLLLVFKTSLYPVKMQQNIPSRFSGSRQFNTTLWFAMLHFTCPNKKFTSAIFSLIFPFFITCSKKPCWNRNVA